jgi:hypothetical protein
MVVADNQQHGQALPETPQKPTASGLDFWQNSVRRSLSSEDFQEHNSKAVHVTFP